VQARRRGEVDDRTDHVRGRLDAVLVAARVAPVTSDIGIVPVATTTHTEPFHVSKAIATLDYVSHGRAGLQARISATELEALQFGRRHIGHPPDAGTVDALFDEAADFLEVVRRLWDSWEDDAEIRHVPTGRFIDRDKLHYIDFESRWFSVKGPSITPRPPQGQPLVTVLAHVPPAFRLAARSADVVFTTPATTESAREIVSTVRAHEDEVGRPDAPLRIFADLLVFLDDDPAKARSRVERLDRIEGRALRSDALVFVGTARQLAGVMEQWQSAGIEGFRLRPGALPHDLTSITHELVGELQERSIFRQHYGEPTVRSRLGLERPANRYAHA
jgi:alkanesulfonate monooxygenase SsuD/methylene tetrahydromethanopterin reductase-like flavin-dependent oxidoreductase (luciferase family)